MSHNTGTTFIELLISIVIASILVLTVGVISSVALSSYNKLNSRQNIYNDLSYGIKLMQNRVRDADASKIQRLTNKPSPPWVNQEQLVVGNEAFGLYQPSGSTMREFVYLKDKTKEAQADREVIFSAPGNKFSWTLNCNPSSCVGLKSIQVILDGEKNKNPFHLETTVAMRNL